MSPTANSYSSFEAQLKAPLAPTIMEPTLSNEYRLASFLGRWSELGEEGCSSHSRPSFPGCSYKAAYISHSDTSGYMGFTADGDDLV